jgi:hypothetical protein
MESTRERAPEPPPAEAEAHTRPTPKRLSSRQSTGSLRRSVTSHPALQRHLHAVASVSVQVRRVAPEGALPRTDGAMRPKSQCRPDRPSRFAVPRPCFVKSVRNAASLFLPRPSLRRVHPSESSPRSQPCRVTATRAPSMFPTPTAVPPRCCQLAGRLPAPRILEALIHERVRCVWSA